MLTITGKALGRKRPLFEEWSVPLPTDIDVTGMTLRELLARIVRLEVAAFRDRQEQRRLLRVLSDDELNAGLADGKIVSGACEIPVQLVDETAAIAAACRAFEDGFYLVIIDGHEHRQLDRAVEIRPNSRIAFVRLTLLAGG